MGLALFQSRDGVRGSFQHIAARHGDACLVMVRKRFILHVHRHALNQWCGILLQALGRTVLTEGYVNKLWELLVSQTDWSSFQGISGRFQGVNHSVKKKRKRTRRKQQKKLHLAYYFLVPEKPNKSSTDAVFWRFVNVTSAQLAQFHMC